MIARRFGAALLILGAGGVTVTTGCIIGGAGLGGSGTGGTTTGTTTATGSTTDTTTTGNTGATTTTGNTGATTTSATTSTGGTCMAPNGDTATDCASACGTAYDCGVETCGGAGQQCPGFKSPLTRSAFIGDSSSNGCLENCMIAGAGFVALVDPTDCVATISNLKNSSQAFATACSSGG
jgi:hypothetical protein